MKRHIVLLAVLCFSGACGGEPTPPPDLVATQIAVEKAAHATMTAEAPTATAMPVDTALPTGTHPPQPTGTSAPKAGEVRTRQSDGMDMVYVPAGEFLMGAADDESQAGEDEKPQHTVYLDGFWIDKLEVSNAQYGSCVDAGVCVASRCEDREELSQPDQPVACVDWEDARTYCEWTGARLLTEAEWEKAARGSDGRTYPWGNSDIDCSKANYKPSCADGPAPVGSYPAGVSPFGALDMAGNVWEWVADWLDYDYYSSSPSQNPQGPTRGEYKLFRGGSWDISLLNARSADRMVGLPSDTYRAVGFRCASTWPTPDRTKSLPTGTASPTNTGATASEPTKPSDSVDHNGPSWTTYANANDILDIAFDGNAVWAATYGGLVRWDLADGSYSRFTVEDGLPSDLVVSVEVDDVGRTWIGTYMGLCMFDGQEWVTYTESDGLASNRVYDIEIDQLGQIWLDTIPRGVTVFDGNSWATYTTEDGLADDVVYDVAIDQEGAVWLGTYAGVTVFNGSEWTSYSTADGLISDWVQLIRVDKHGGKWFGTSDGISHFDGNTWTNYRNEDLFGSDSRRAATLAVDNNGDVWLRDSSITGLWKFSGGARTFVESENRFSPANHMEIDERGFLWLATEHGLTSYDGSNWTTYATEEVLPRNHVSAIAIDEQGRAWLGHGSLGVTMFDGQTWRAYTEDDGLVSNRVSDVAVDADGRLWVATQDGASVFDGDHWTIHLNNGGDGGSVGEIEFSSDGNVWLAGRDWTPSGGAYRFDGQTWTYYSDENGFTADWVSALLEDESGRMWFGTHNSGVSVFDGQEWAWYDHNDGLVSDGVADIAADCEGRIWVGTRHDGVSVFDGAEWVTYTSEDGLASNWVTVVVRDALCNMWFGTQYGASVFDGSAWTTYTRTDGMTDSYVVDIAIDARNRKWFGTKDGAVNVFDDGTQFPGATGASAAFPQEAATLTPEPNLGIVLSKVKTLQSDDRVWDLRWSPDGKSLAVYRYIEGYEVWDVEHGQRWPPRIGRFADWSNDGSKLAIVVSGRVDVWDGRAAEVLLSIPVERASQFDWSADDQSIAVRASEEPVTIWDSSTGALIVDIQDDGSSAFSVAYSPDGKYLAIDFADVVLWNVHSREIDHRIPLAGSPAWSPDSQRIVVRTRTGIDIYDLETGMYSFRSQAEFTRAIGLSLIDWSSDGSLIAASTGTRISLWDPNTGVSLGSVEGPGSDLYGLQFSPDSQYLAVGSAAGEILVYEIERK